MVYLVLIWKGLSFSWLDTHIDFYSILCMLFLLCLKKEEGFLGIKGVKTAFR